MPRYNKPNITPYSGPGYVQGPPSAGKFVDSAGAAKQRSMAIWAGLSKSAFQAGIEITKEAVSEDEMEAQAMAFKDAADGLAKTEKQLREQSALYETDTRAGVPVEDRRGMALTPAHYRAYSKTRAVIKTQQAVSAFQDSMANATEAQLSDPAFPEKSMQSQLSDIMKTPEMGEDPEYASTFVKTFLPYRQSLVAQHTAQASTKFKANVLDNYSTIFTDGISTAETKDEAVTFIQEFFNGDADDQSDNGFHGAGFNTPERRASLISDALDTALDNPDANLSDTVAAINESVIGPSGEKLGSYKDVKNLLRTYEPNIKAHTATRTILSKAKERGDLTVRINSLQDLATEQEITTESGKIVTEMLKLFEPEEQEALYAKIGLSKQDAVRSLTDTLTQRKMEEKNRNMALGHFLGTPVVDAAGNPKIDAAGNIVRDPSTGHIGKILELAETVGIGTQSLTSLLENAFAEGEALGINFSKAGMTPAKIRRTIERTLSGRFTQSGLEAMGATHTVQDAAGNDVEELLPLDDRVNLFASSTSPQIEQWAILNPGKTNEDIRTFLSSIYSIARLDPNTIPGIVDPNMEPDELAELKEAWKAEHSKAADLLKGFGQLGSMLIGRNKSVDILNSLAPTGNGPGEFLEKMHQQLQNGLSINDAFTKVMVDLPNQNDTELSIEGLRSAVGGDKDWDPSEARIDIWRNLVESFGGAVHDDLENGYALMEGEDFGGDDADVLTKDPAGWYLQNLGVNIVLAKAHKLYNQAPELGSGAYHGAMRWGQDTIRCGDNSLFTNMDVAYGAKHGDMSGTFGMGATENDWGWFDFENAHNQVVMDFITSPGSEGGLGFQYDANDAFKFGGEFLDAYEADQLEVGLGEEEINKWKGTLSGMKRHEMLLIQSDDEQSFRVMWAQPGGKQAITLGPKIPVATFTAFFDTHKKKYTTDWDNYRVLTSSLASGRK
tara:strand:+ start:4066 stop:6918 length:2853 start_codon:yes stop_codon:yes gene_type:complete